MHRRTFALSSRNPRIEEECKIWIFLDLRHFTDWCCFLYSIWHILVALLEAVFAGIKGNFYCDSSGIPEFVTAAHDSDLRAASPKENFQVCQLLSRKAINIFMTSTWKCTACARDGRIEGEGGKSGCGSYVPVRRSFVVVQAILTEYPWASRSW